MEMWRRTLAIVRKDLLIEARTRQGLNAMFFFAALVLLMFSFAIGPEPELLRRLAGGLLWIGITFTGTLSLGRAFQTEDLAGGLRHLRLYPGEVRSIYLGKLLGNLIVLLLIEAVLFPAAALLYRLDLWSHALPLIGIAVLGSIGFATVGTFYAALTVHIRARELMLPLLLFPAIVPLLLAATGATGAVLLGDPMGRGAAWLRVLVAYDIISLVICLWIFPIVLEE